MNHLKEFCKRPEENIEFFLTYADNFAIVFFKKQGFKMPVTMPRERWAPYIKDYEGGTLMECILSAKWPTDFPRVIRAQRDAVEVRAHAGIAHRACAQCAGMLTRGGGVQAKVREKLYDPRNVAPFAEVALAGSWTEETGFTGHGAAQLVCEPFEAAAMGQYSLWLSAGTDDRPTVNAPSPTTAGGARWTWRQASAVAAALVLGVLLGAPFLSSSQPLPLMSDGGRVVAVAALETVLDT
jgi:hypothetical protein